MMLSVHKEFCNHLILIRDFLDVVPNFSFYVQMVAQVTILSCSEETKGNIYLSASHFTLIP